MSYNYENDPDILKVAKQLEAMQDDRIYCEFLNQCEPTILPFYDFRKVSEKNPDLFGREYPSPETQRQSILDFISQFTFLFTYCNSYFFKRSPDDVNLGVAELLNELFNEYALKIQQINGYDFGKVIEGVQLWGAITSELIDDIYKCVDSADDAFGRKEYTFSLCQELKASVCCCYESFVENLTYGPFVPASKIILYNFWGDEYTSKVGQIRLDVARNAEEQKMTDLLSNKIYFAETIRGIFNDSESSAVSPETIHSRNYSSELRDLIQNLFSAYTKHLRRKQIVARGTLIFAVKYWHMTTRNIIIREAFNQLERVRLSGYTPGDNVNHIVFRTTIQEKSRFEIVQKLQKIGLDYAKIISDDYLNKLQNGELVYEWAGDIDNLQIDYLKLWKAMNNKFISGIDSEVLEDAIKCADLSPIQLHVINPERNDGAIITLAQCIGKSVDSWWVSAAPTLHNTKGQAHTKASIQKLKPSSEASLEMIEIYYSCTPKTSSKKKQLI